MVKILRILTAIKSLLSINCSIFFSLFFSLTNIVYLSAVTSLLSIPFFLKAVLFDKRKIHPIQISLILFFSYALVSAALYDFKQLFQFGFYRFDAVFFVSYSPLLLFGVPGFKSNTRDLFICLFLVSIVLASISHVFLIYSSIINNTLLFTSTSAASGFFALMGGFVFFHNFSNKKFIKYLFFLFLIFFLFITSSRGGLLALTLGIVSVWFICRKLKILRCIPLLGFLSINFLFILMAFHPSIYEKIGSINTILKSNITSSLSTFNLASKTDDTLGNVELGDVKMINDSVRVYAYWKKVLLGVDQSSILFGNGLGSYNDYLYGCRDSSNQIKYSKWDAYLDFYKFACNKIIDIKKSDTPLFNSEHAHNSIFHFFFELGITGVILALTLFFLIYKEILKLPIGIRKQFLCMGFIILFSSIADNRMTAPAIVLPFVLLFLVYTASENNAV